MGSCQGDGRALGRRFYAMHIYTRAHVCTPLRHTLVGGMPSSWHVRFASGFSTFGRSYVKGGIGSVLEPPRRVCLWASTWRIIGREYQHMDPSPVSFIHAIFQPNEAHLCVCVSVEPKFSTGQSECYWKEDTQTHSHTL